MFGDDGWYVGNAKLSLTIKKQNWVLSFYTQIFLQIESHSEQSYIGKKLIGEIAELDDQFAIIKNGNVDSFYKNLEKAVEILIENYNLAK